MKARIPQNMQGGPQNMNLLIRQAQKMQEDMAALQAGLEAKEFKASVGGGAVEIVMNGKHEVKSVQIKPEAVNTEEVEMVKDRSASAVQEGIQNIDAESSDGMEKIAGGMSLPGMGVPGLF